jgi:hypothetical protein
VSGKTAGCATCDGSGVLTVPDSDGESASEYACPDPVHNGKTAGQQACIAWNAAYAEQYGIEARNEWAASDPRGRAAWEAAAAAVETDQLRLARESRDDLKRRMLDLAAKFEGQGLGGVAYLIRKELNL